MRLACRRAREFGNVSPYLRMCQINLANFYETPDFNGTFVVANCCEHLVLPNKSLCQHMFDLSNSILNCISLGMSSCWLNPRCAVLFCRGLPSTNACQTHKLQTNCARFCTSAFNTIWHLFGPDHVTIFLNESDCLFVAGLQHYFV